MVEQAFHRRNERAELEPVARRKLRWQRAVLGQHAIIAGAECDRDRARGITKRDPTGEPAPLPEPRQMRDGMSFATHIRQSARGARAVQAMNTGGVEAFKAAQQARGKMVQRRLSQAQENPVTAIDIALEPNAAMVQRAEADNARLLKAYPEGFALDATHHAHITMLQQFVRTADLDKVYSAACAVLAKEGTAIRRLKAI